MHAEQQYLACNFAAFLSSIHMQAPLLTMWSVIAAELPELLAGTLAMEVPLSSGLHTQGILANIIRRIC